MLVPRYWSEAKGTRPVDGRQLSLRRFGWSDDSEAEATAHAESRLAAAFTQAANGEPVEQRDRKVPYNGAEGLPIREEVIDSFEDCVLTRNAYGALCLNTPDVLFADIDVETPSTAPFGCLAFLTLAFGAVIAGSAVGSTALALLGLVAATFLAPVCGGLLRRITAGRRPDPFAVAEERIRAFAEAHPDWHLRVYRSPAGFRLLAMQACFDPQGEAAAALFQAIQADPVYVTMCRRQNCFRARISPKPWRIGITEHLKPQPGVWPIEPERLPERRRWVDHYNRIAEGFASCRFCYRLGSGRVHAKAELVRAVHDRFCQAESDLPLA
jgi:hypothetical protein